MNAPQTDTVRNDFIEAYTARWGCARAYAESLLEHVELTAAASRLRLASADRELMTATHLKIENELIELRDRGILTANRNGLVVFDEDGTPSPVIRMGTRQAVIRILGLMADHFEEA